VAAKGPVGLERYDASTAGMIAFVGSLPGELHARAAGRIEGPTAHPTFDGDESESAGAVVVELEEAGTQEFDRVSVPPIHLDDSPLPDQIRRSDRRGTRSCSSVVSVVGVTDRRRRAGCGARMEEFVGLSGRTWRQRRISCAAPRSEQGVCIDLEHLHHLRGHQRDPATDHQPGHLRGAHQVAEPAIGGLTVAVPTGRGHGGTRPIPRWWSPPGVGATPVPVAPCRCG